MKVIQLCKKSKTLHLLDAPHLGPHWKQLGPYLAMYYHRYMNIKWEGWNLEEPPTLELLQRVVQPTRWEEYVFSIIVVEDFTEDELLQSVKVLGYPPDYILQKQTGKITLLHETDYIDSLVKNGYILKESDIAEPNYSFGMGLYCLDKELYDEHGGDWDKNDNVYVGHYEGEYLRCIEDTWNGLKDGNHLKFQQEIIIPFNEKEIQWEMRGRDK